MTESHPCGFWERDPAQPGGEVFVAGKQIVEIALTQQAREALHDGRLLRVNEAGEAMPWP